MSLVTKTNKQTILIIIKQIIKKCNEKRENKNKTLAMKN